MRNVNLFNNKKEHVKTENTIAKAIESFFIIGKGNTGHSTNKISMNIKWEPPDRECFKLNTDGSIVGRIGIIGIDGVVRNSKGDWVMGFVKSITHNTTVHSELCVLHEGLLMAWNQNHVPLQISVDSTEVANPEIGELTS
ncbi:uncharacterized protein LOC132630491 [Lycium barbarum]|uniref:uncharacterized protein LOC132630491 n=1 Tax=Lycium barbarum TaxID=112863 RepID=UPI00293E1A2A|nr:uncharacterized protein LOC132630491 [Lycium barbarum]